MVPCLRRGGGGRVIKLGRLLVLYDARCIDGKQVRPRLFDAPYTVRVYGSGFREALGLGHRIE